MIKFHKHDMDRDINVFDVSVTITEATSISFDCDSLQDQVSICGCDIKLWYNEEKKHNQLFNV